ncbi:MAG: hypothetical protein ACM3TN_19355 [Alphaproteobacteria bacterium]
MANIDRTIYRSRSVVIAILLTFVLVSQSQAQVDQAPAAGSHTLELVDQLKDLIRGAERDQRSSAWLTQQLRELVRRYDWPWRAQLLYDDFRDGDYTSNPRWIVSNGDFWVTRDSALRSVFDPPPQTHRRGDPAIEIMQGILWGGTANARRETQANSQSAAEIYTRLPISNAFATKSQLRFRNNPGTSNRLEFGPYQGDARDSGYRLAYESGKVPSISLLRVAPGRSAVLDSYDRELQLEDGSPHTVEWRRGNDGKMVVLLDEEEIIRTVDRAYSDSFDGFTFINRGGVYELKEISIFGTRR